MQVSLTPPAAPALDKAHADLKKACQQFESYFTDLMLKEMRKTAPRNNLLGDQSNQQQIFQDMMDQKIADNLSQRSSLGLGQMMYNELTPSLGSAQALATGETPKAETETRR